MHSPWYRFALQTGGKITLELSPFAEVLDNAVKQIVHSDESEPKVSPWLHLEILGHPFVHVQLQIHPGHFASEHGLWHGEQHRSATVELLVLVVGAPVRTIVPSVRRQRCPFVVQHSEHYDGLLHDRDVEHIGPWHVQLLDGFRHIRKFSEDAVPRIENVGQVDWFCQVIFFIYVYKIVAIRRSLAINTYRIVRFEIFICENGLRRFFLRVASFCGEAKPYLLAWSLPLKIRILKGNERKQWDDTF